jgi:hypothetical protein
VFFSRKPAAFREPTTDLAVIVVATGTGESSRKPAPAAPGRQGWRHAYLIDGVAINGVSWGQVVYSAEAVIPEAPASSTQEPDQSVRRLSTQYRQACAASQPGLEAL